MTEPCYHQLILVHFKSGTTEILQGEKPAFEVEITALIQFSQSKQCELDPI